MTMPRLCALIPARGGSKRILRKNIVNFAGMPLILHSIKAAKESGLFQDIFVSTEDPEIKKICFPQCTVIDRPPVLATDQATLRDVCEDFVQKYQYQYDYFCLLEADCPLRGPKELQESWEHFSKNINSVLMSVFRYGMFYPFWAMIQKKEGYGFFFPQYIKKSQDLPQAVCPSGAFKWVNIQKFLKHKSLFPKDLGVFVLDWFKAIDIDTYEDLITAKMVKNFLSQNPTFFERERAAIEIEKKQR